MAEKANIQAKPKVENNSKTLKATPFFPSKLTEPGNAFAQGADTIASVVMRKMDTVPQSFFKPTAISSIQRKCQHCDEDEKKVQRKEGPAEIMSQFTQLVNTPAGMVQRQTGMDDVEAESDAQRDRFRAERRRDLDRVIDCNRFSKIRRDCPPSTGVRLADVLARVRSRVAGNPACIRFFADNFHINPDRMFDPAQRPSITFEPNLGVSGNTRCPEPTCDHPGHSVSVGNATANDNICNSPLLDRVLMHELTHYAQCYVRWGQTSSEEIAERGAVICTGTVQEALDAARARGRTPGTGTPPPTIQPKLSINQPGDEYEKEADAMANKVMRMSDGTTGEGLFSPSISSIQRKCQHCEEEEKKVQRKETSDAALTPPSETYIQSLSGKGRSLTTGERDFFEPRFGYDFSSVRLHADAEANKSAADINALAYTNQNNIVFGSGQYDTGTDKGKQLMAHELTHVVQQSQNKLQRAVQRQTITLNSGRQVGSTPAPAANLREDVLEVMDSLHSSWAINNPDYAAEYPTVSAVQHMGHVPVASIPHTIAAITANEQPILNNTVASGVFGLTLTNGVGRGMANVKADIATLQGHLHTHQFLSTGNFTAESAVVSAGPDPVPEASIPQTLAALSAMKIAKLALGFRPHDIMAGTHALTATQRSQVEAQLIPGASSSGGVVSLPTPDAICSTIPALETEIRANIVPYVHTTAATFNATRASPPVLPIPQMNSMADVVQQELQSYFGDYLRSATHTAASAFTPGQYTVRSQLRDQSTTVRWQTDDGRKSWVNYWISTRMGNAHHCNTADIDTVAHNIAVDPLLTADIDTTVQSWPAEATGGININPFIRDASAGPAEIRRGRWDAFTTIMHEAIHHLAHPDFVNAFNQMQDDSMQILKEGFNDMFRHELWFGAGNLRTRIAQPAYNANRTIIEGAAFPYNAGVVYYHPEYGQRVEATRIRNIVGDANAKAAYFLGHTELLGLGSGSHGLSSTGSYTNIASYHTTDPGEGNIVTTIAGETYAALIARLNTPSGTVRDAATGNWVPPAAASLPARVRVAGIRHITVIAGDTMLSIAYQNGVTPDGLRRANNLTTNALTIGQRLVVPVH